MRFAGYAAVFDRIDAGGDVVRKGAFAASLGRGGAVPLLWEHRAGAPIGRIERLEEDRRGLRVIGAISDARAIRLIRAGRVTGLSFGYRVRAASAGRPRALTGLDLVEISLVAFPMQPLARVHALAAEAPALRSGAGSDPGLERLAG